MKLDIKNIGIISSSQIELNGITIIAGENNSGKSTIGRILYSIISTGSDSAKKTLYHEFGNPNNGNVSLYNDDEIILNIDLKENMEFTNADIPFHNIFYLESPYVLDELDIHIKTGQTPQGHRKKVDLLQKLKEQKSSSTKDIICDELKVRLEKIVNGHFETSDQGLLFVSDNSTVNACHMAAGLKTYSIIKMLLDNNALDKQSMFIFDEPEIHLHPDWQVDLAEILVFIHKEIGVSLLINTHSPYFLRALQLFCKKYDVNQSTKYYFSKRSREGHGVITDVSDDLSDVYATLSKPFENLWELNDLYD